MLIFRRSIYNYLFRQGMVDEATAKDPPVAEAWRRQGGWIEHLWTTSAENWASYGSGQSPDRLGHEHRARRPSRIDPFLRVEPGVQSKGLGRALIEKAFPPGHGDHRSINATQDPRALSIYLRSGVSHVATSVDVLLRPGTFDSDSDLIFERALRRQRVRYRRSSPWNEPFSASPTKPNIRFLLAGRPAWLAMRDGSPRRVCLGVPTQSSRGRRCLACLGRWRHSTRTICPP